VRGGTPTTTGSRETGACGRPCRRLRRGLCALRLCTARPARRHVLGVAGRFPGLHTRSRSTLRASTPPSGVRHGAPPGGHARETPGRARDAWPLPYAPTLLCNASVSGRVRQSDGAGTPGAQGRQNDHDLHARAAARRARGGEPARSTRSSVKCRSGSPSPSALWRDYVGAGA
jgi:hypothetical protein